ncbi:hypothetical protein ACHAXS_009517 [Conticribra weissflogii]
MDNKRKPNPIAHGPTVHAIKRAKFEAKQERLRQQQKMQNVQNNLQASMVTLPSPCQQSEEQKPLPQNSSLQQRQMQHFDRWIQWLKSDGCGGGLRENYAAFITVQDVQDIRRLRTGYSESKKPLRLDTRRHIGKSNICSEQDSGSNADEAESNRLKRLEQIAQWIEPFFDLKQTPTHSSSSQAINHGEEERRLFIAEGTEPVRLMIQRCQSTPDDDQNASSMSASTESTSSTSMPPVKMLSILSKPAAFFEPPVCLLNDIEKRKFITPAPLSENSSPHSPLKQQAGNEINPPFKIIIGSEEALTEIVGFPVARGAMACGVVPSYLRKDAFTWLKNLLLDKNAIDRFNDNASNGNCGAQMENSSRDSLNESVGSFQLATQLSVKHFRPKRIIAFDAVSNTANMGSILRTAAALSIDAIVLSDDSCDAWYRQSVRVSMGHVLSVPSMRVGDWERGFEARGCGGENSITDTLNTEENDISSQVRGLPRLIRWLREMNVECVAAVVDDDEASNEVTISNRAFSGDFAREQSSRKRFPPLVTLESLSQSSSGTTRVNTRSWCCVLGNEGHGIRDEVIQECDKRIRIGMSKGVDSFSLPVAAGILMHGLAQRE